MKTILIVDDEFEVTDILRWLFEWNDFKVHTAANGREALSSVERHAVDLCIIDLMMPIMDGIELVRHMKENPATQSIPIIMMSAGPPDFDDIKFDYFFRKPFLFQDLLAQVKTILNGA